MIREQEKNLSPFIRFLDCLAIFLSYAICAPLSFGVIKFTGSLFTFPKDPGFTFLALPFCWDSYITLLPLIFILLVALLNASYSYYSIGLQKCSGFICPPGLSCFLACCIFILFIIIYPPIKGTLCFIVMFHCLAWVLFSFNRAMVFVFLKYEQKRGIFIHHLLILGTNDTAEKAARFYDAHPELGTRIVGFLTDDENKSGGRILSYKIIGLINDLDSVLKNNIVDRILFAGGVESLSQIKNIARRCEIEGIDFAVTLSVLGEGQGDIFTEHFDADSIILFKSSGHRPQKLFLKRIFDIFASTALLIICLPLWLLIPVLIRRDSPGPAFFRQERVGKNGRLFTMYKFRSMVADAEKLQEGLMHLNEMDGPVFKIKDDPRLTSIGKFLRKTSLDELPQVFNIIKGDMSLVGPRPPVMKEVLQYRPWEKKRLSVAPGITCLWQVSGRNDISFEEWVKLDIQYIKNWSLTLDFKIILMTIPAVLSRKGAR